MTVFTNTRPRDPWPRWTKFTPLHPTIFRREHS